MDTRVIKRWLLTANITEHFLLINNAGIRVGSYYWRQHVIIFLLVSMNMSRHSKKSVQSTVVNSKVANYSDVDQPGMNQ